MIILTAQFGHKKHLSEVTLRS